MAATRIVFVGVMVALFAAAGRAPGHHSPPPRSGTAAGATTTVPASAIRTVNRTLLRINGLKRPVRKAALRHPG